MKQEQLNRILRLVNKTGDKFIVADQETDGVFVVMDMLDYEEMQGVYDESDEWDFDDEEDDNLNINELADFTEKDANITEIEDFTEKEPEISQINDFSEDFLSVEPDIKENAENVEDLEKKDDFVEEKDRDETLEYSLKKQNEHPSFTHLGQLLKNKDFLKEEPVVEEINPLNELNNLYEETEEVADQEDLSEEDKDRFYLEPV